MGSPRPFPPSLLRSFGGQSKASRCPAYSKLYAQIYSNLKHGASRLVNLVLDAGSWVFYVSVLNKFIMPRQGHMCAGPSGQRAGGGERNSWRPQRRSSGIAIRSLFDRRSASEGGWRSMAAGLGLSRISVRGEALPGLDFSLQR